jgi:hypothetical protein
MAFTVKLGDTIPIRVFIFETVCFDRIRGSERNALVFRRGFWPRPQRPGVMGWVAVAHGGIDGDLVRDMMLEAVEYRFAAGDREGRGVTAGRWAPAEGLVTVSGSMPFPDRPTRGRLL